MFIQIANKSAKASYQCGHSGGGRIAGHVPAGHRAAELVVQVQDVLFGVLGQDDQLAVYRTERAVVVRFAARHVRLVVFCGVKEKLKN